jgi:DNA (cytosine-5)-methyltransferase 1
MRQVLDHLDDVLMKPILDLYCGAGLAADGYLAAGFGVHGVDINPQPHYPGTFLRYDALEAADWYLRHSPRFAHASPPCQMHTRAKHLRKAQGGESKYPDLLTPTLAKLRAWGGPWVVENVPGAPFDPQPGETLITLCGSMFGLGVQRHRLFLSNMPISAPGPCRHDTFEKDPVTGKPRPWGVYHVPGDSIPNGGRTARNAEHAAQLMGVQRALPWNSLKEGFPPAYTHHIGLQLMAHLQGRAA